MEYNTRRGAAHADTGIDTHTLVLRLCDPSLTGPAAKLAKYWGREQLSDGRIYGGVPTTACLISAVDVSGFPTERCTPHDNVFMCAGVIGAYGILHDETDDEGHLVVKLVAPRDPTTSNRLDVPNWVLRFKPYLETRLQQRGYRREAPVIHSSYHCQSARQWERAHDALMGAWIEIANQPGLRNDKKSVYARQFWLEPKLG